MAAVTWPSAAMEAVMRVVVVGVLLVSQGMGAAMAWEAREVKAAATTNTAAPYPLAQTHLDSLVDDRTVGVPAERSPRSAASLTVRTAPSQP